MKKLIPVPDVARGLGLILSACITIQVSASSPLTTIPEIRHLPPETAAAKQPVVIESQVIRNHMGLGLFLFDGSEGIYVNAPQSNELLETIAPGQIVRITGHSSAGGFVPSVRADKIEILGNQPLPTARPFSSKELYSTTIDCDWVSVSGRLISMRTATVVSENIVVELEQDNLRYALQLPYTRKNEETLADKMLQQVSFNAVVGTLYNKHRQVAGRVFFVDSAEDFLPSDNSLTEIGTTIVPIHDLMRIGFNHDSPVRIRGIVTSAQGRNLTLRGERASIRATLLSAPNVHIGDQVVLEGYVWPRPIGPAFRARTLQVEQMATQEPLPVPMKLTPELNETYNADLVTLAIQLIDIKVSSKQNVQQASLLCRSDNYRFEATLPTGESIDSNVKPGALLKLSGICLLEQHPEEQWRVLSDRFSLQLRNANDIVVLKNAAWWTQQKLFGLSLIIMAMAGLFLFWITMLRRTVNRQTQVISQQVKKVAVMDERQRVARELHDNLDQGLVGAALQIRSGKRMLETGGPVNSDTLKQTMDLAQQMLEHCSVEARSAIHDLRGGILERMDLASAINDAAQTLNEESKATVSFTTKGVSFRLKAEAERNLLLIAKEAATNAVRHGSPVSVKVDLSFNANELRLTVQDNGCGFDTNKSSNRFGILGMQERAARLGGKLTISSSDDGTTVEFKQTNPQHWKAT